MATTDDANEIAEGLMAVGALLEPMIEFASGFRAKLTDAGWSDQVADEVSGEMLKRLLAMGMNSDRD